MKYVFLLLPLLCASLLAVEPEALPPSDVDIPKPSPQEEVSQKSFNPPPGPYLTGPLLTPSGNTVPEGHYNIEPYLFVNGAVAYHNNHWHIQRFHEPKESINIQLPVQIGLTPFMDLLINPQFFFNREGDVDAWRFGDLQLGMEFQLLREDFEKGIPAIKFGLIELFPTGDYQNLQIKKLGTDASGGGSFVTAFVLVTTYLWTFTQPHFLAARLSTSAQLFSTVRVTGINTYGGDTTTVGRVFPGTAFQALLGLEYTLSKNWALALDCANVLTLSTNFKGRTIAPIGNNTISYQFSLAPAIEYNHSPHIGIIGGIWFTVVGLHTFDFFNGILAINWFI